MAKEKKEKKAEKQFVVGFAGLKNRPKPQRANKAIGVLKKFIFKHTRVKPENVLISNKVNEAIWQRGREKVLKKLAIKVILAEGKANVFLKGEKLKAKKEEKKKEKPEEKKTEEEKAFEEEKQKKKDEKKLAEKAAEKAAMKRGKE